MTCVKLLLQKVATCLVLIQNNCKASEFELKVLQRVRCWIKNFKICQIVIFKFHNESVFESKILQRVTL